jgi:putative salt-induced outer membrane protein YdiY
VLGLLLAAPAWAGDDVVFLKNGDKVSGTVVKIDGGAVTITTGYAKEVTISQDEVAGVDMRAPARIVLTTGEAFVGRLEREGDVLHLMTDAGPRDVQVADIESVGVPEVAWANLVGLSVLGTTGNTRSSAIGAKAELIRTTKANKLSIGGRADYQERDQATTVQTAFGRIRFDHNLTPSWFLGVFDEAEHDFFKNIRIRNRFGVGPGYRIINTKSMLLSAFGGVAYTYVNFRNAPDDNFATAVVSEEFRWNIAEAQLLYQLLDIYPNLQHGSDWSMRAEVGFRQNIAAGIFLDLALVDEYNHNPAPGRQTNDFRYTVSLGYAW